MKNYRFEALLQNQGWLEKPCVSVDENGRIVSISQSENGEYINGYAIPAFQNAHSHAFQYAMAGLAENHSATADDFWAWREAMYSLALNLDPEQIKTIAAMLYAELLRHGYSNVAEFHYIHHAPNGAPYANSAEIGAALIEAAKETGIKLTLVPIFYQKGGFGVAPTERQRRFISKTFEDYARLFEASADACKSYENANIAVGVHSMRGVFHEDILRAVNELSQNVPFHIHVSEQLKEVEDCLTFLGKRPVEWLLENVDLNERFHLVHATHLTETETENLAKSGANVVLCPTTEGNLGDGIFPLRNYQKHGGNWSIGTDSHVSLNPLEELRLLDYVQRLTTHKRDTFTDEKTSDSGLFAIKKATLAGRRAMNNYETEFFAEGNFFDACVIRADAPLLADVNPETRSSTIVYATDASVFDGTFVNGKLIRTGENYERIKRKFIETVRNFR